MTPPPHPPPPESGPPGPGRVDVGCEVDGCAAHPLTGATIIATSGRGVPFRGRCTAHFDGVPDAAIPVFDAIVARLGWPGTAGAADG